MVEVTLHQQRPDFRQLSEMHSPTPVIRQKSYILLLAGFIHIANWVARAAACYASALPTSIANSTAATAASAQWRHLAADWQHTFIFSACMIMSRLTAVWLVTTELLLVMMIMITMIKQLRHTGA